MLPFLGGFQTARVLKYEGILQRCIKPPRSRCSIKSTDKAIKKYLVVVINSPLNPATLGTSAVRLIPEIISSSLSLPFFFTALCYFFMAFVFYGY